MRARKYNILTNCDEQTRVYQLDNLYRLNREMCARKYPPPHLTHTEIITKTEAKMQSNRTYRINTAQSLA